LENLREEKTIDNERKRKEEMRKKERISSSTESLASLSRILHDSTI